MVPQPMGPAHQARPRRPPLGLLARRGRRGGGGAQRATLTVPGEKLLLGGISGAPMEAPIENHRCPRPPSESRPRVQNRRCGSRRSARRARLRHSSGCSVALPVELLYCARSPRPGFSASTCNHSQGGSGPGRASADLVLALPWIAAREGRIDGPAPESRQFLTGSMALIDTCQSIASTSGAFAFELDRPPTLIA
jgi:hypothetical protein